MLVSKMNPACRAAVVIPCFNEINLIDSTVQTIVASLAVVKGSTEVIYVDKGSTDGTREYLDDIAQKTPGVAVITESVAGIGHARRTGIRLALARAAVRKGPTHDDFWLINSDADVEVPTSWLKDWLHEFTTNPALVLTASGRFPNALADRLPNAYEALMRSNEVVGHMTELFGAINTDGTNSAIERKAYAAIGPFEQPADTEDGRARLLAGEDWDMGTRARLLAMHVGNHGSKPVTISSRRFEDDMEAFFTGEAYDREFLRVDGHSDLADLPKVDITKMATVSVHRLCMHTVCKPILVEPHLLDKEEVSDFLGEDIVAGMKAWIAKTPRPDLFTDRNGFILEYLVDCHNAFSDKISQRALERYLPSSK